jgi:Ser/Thr protein kinase RdoA (MazF antagonist)
VDDYVRKTGAALATLHGSGVHVGAPLDFNHEFEELREDLDELIRAAPQLQGAADRFLASLKDLAVRFPVDPPVSSHGAFRPDQVLVSDGEVGFVDFDGLCQAEPALDVAEFLSKLRSVSLTVGKGEGDVVDDAQLPALLARADQLSDLFLAAYERHRPLSLERVMLWEALSLLRRLVDGWAKVKPARLRMNVLLMQRFLDTHHQIVA